MYIQSLYDLYAMRTRTFNISLPNQLVKALDRRAREEARSRSEVLRAAALAYLDWWKQWRQLQTHGRRQARRLDLHPRDVERLISEVRTQPSSR
jgi:metal-responsive CopG/Arc/MetJ family transcriptional regulator